MSKAGKIPASHFATSAASSFRRIVGQRPKRRFLGHQYIKNSLTMFNELQDKVLDAISRAKRGHVLQQQQKVAYHQMNPATTVYKLVKELLAYMDSLD